MRNNHFHFIYSIVQNDPRFRRVKLGVLCSTVSDPWFCVSTSTYLRIEN